MSDANVFNTAPGMKIEASWEMLDSRNMAKSRALKSMLLNVCHTLALCVRTGLGTAVRKMSGLREVVVVGIHYQTSSLSLAANTGKITRGTHFTQLSVGILVGLEVWRPQQMAMVINAFEFVFVRFHARYETHRKTP